MKFVLPLFFNLLFVFSTSAQNFQIISGQLLDQKSGSPIPYANIGIPERGIGTTSNDDGQFTFKVPDQYAQSNLIVSVIGYKTFTYPLKQISSPTIIELEPTSYTLSEVQIFDENGVENIIRKAIQNIPQNYPSHASSVLGFYRESRTDSFDQHVYLAEGVLNIYKTSYKNSNEGMVSLVQGRKINLKNPLDTIIKGGFTSGHMAAHRFDFVKNREDFINEDYFPAYKYWIEKITSYNGKEVYVIGFDKDPDAKNLKSGKKSNASFLGRLLGGSKSSKLDARLRGKVYIDKETYAFIRAEFEVTKEGLKTYNDYPLYSGRWTSNKYIVNYQFHDGKWYFSDALREGGRYSGGLYSNEIKITEINTEKGKPIPYLERLDRGEEFVDMTGSYDENFWKFYNTVPMSEKLAESMHQFNNAQKAQEVFSTERMQEIKELRDSISIAKRIEQAEKEAKENDEVFDPENITFGEPGLVKQEHKRLRIETIVGLGGHMMTTPESQFQVTYLNHEKDASLLEISDDFLARDFEIIYNAGINLVLNDRWFFRFTGSRDFGRTIYRESTSGLGAQINLSKQRPVFLKLLASHSRTHYARLIGSTKNTHDKITIGNRNFNSKNIRVFYGSKTHHIKLSGEVSIELNKNKELFFRGSYLLPFSQKQYAYFREASFLFKKRTKIPVDNDRLSVTNSISPDIEFTEPLNDANTIQLTIGYVFK